MAQALSKAADLEQCAEADDLGCRRRVPDVCQHVALALERQQPQETLARPCQRPASASISRQFRIASVATASKCLMRWQWMQQNYHVTDAPLRLPVVIVTTTGQGPERTLEGDDGAVIAVDGLKHGKALAQPPVAVPAQLLRMKRRAGQRTPASRQPRT